MNPSLDSLLRTRATQYQKKGFGQTYDSVDSMIESIARLLMNRT